MIDLICEGYDAAYELGNICNLFIPYVGEKVIVKAVYETDFAKAYLYKGEVLLYEAAYPIVLANDEIRDKKAIKEALKKAVYDTLKEYTGREMPWGILTGIRPTILDHEALKSGMSDEAIDGYLEEA